MKKAPLPALKRPGMGGLKWPLAALCFWMRSAICHCRCRPNCCVPSSLNIFSGLVAARTFRLICGWSAPPIRISKPTSTPANSALTCFTGSMSFQLNCQLLPSVRLIFRKLLSRCAARSRHKANCLACRNLMTVRYRNLAAIHGQAMSVNYAM